MWSSTVWLAMNCRRSGIIPGCAFATTVFQLMLVELLREVRSAHPTVFIRVVVDGLSLQSFVADNLLTQAWCEKATKKSKVLSNCVSVITPKLQLRLAPLGVQASRAERNLGIDFASGKRVFTVVRRARLETSKERARRIRKIHGRSSVPFRQRLAQVARTSVSKALRGCGHPAH